MDVSKFVQTFVDGLANGAIYASLALALVLVHRATHIPNFAQGEMAMISAFIAWEIQERYGTAVVAWVGALRGVDGPVVPPRLLHRAGHHPLGRELVAADAADRHARAAGDHNERRRLALGLPARSGRSRRSRPSPIRVGDVVLSWQTIGIVLVLIVVMLARLRAVQVHQARPRAARRGRQPAARPSSSGSTSA